MARAQKLKVFRTPVGFHDAYVAAPSQRAALQAWGVDHDLFALGMAERVTDPALIAEMLEKPGVVVRRSRGTAAEQIAALPPDRSKPPRKSNDAAKANAPAVSRSPQPTPAKPSKREPARKPPPSRARVEDAERRLREARSRYQTETRDLALDEAKLARRRRRLEAAREAEMERLEKAEARARRVYASALERWRDR